MLSRYRTGRSRSAGAAECVRAWVWIKCVSSSSAYGRDSWQILRPTTIDSPTFQARLLFFPGRDHHECGAAGRWAGGGGCGTCTRCLDACPTGAIVAPYELDARRCISYLTIELKGEIPEELRPAIAQSGNRIYGCDICQEVCPFNRPAATSAHPTLTPTREPAFQPRAATTGRTLAELAVLTEEEFREQFKGSPVKRAKWRGLMRNVAAALATDEGRKAG